MDRGTAITQPGLAGSRRVRLAYAAVGVIFLGLFGRFYVPGAGFAYLIDFGTAQQLPVIREFRALNYHLENGGYGYDAQYYVQLAMHPGLRADDLRAAIDNLPYRARRILFGWTAYVLGLGRPAWILQAYTLQNALAWLVLAGVLLRWFAPDRWGNLLRWTGVLFCGGMCVSVRAALVDGPSLLLIALGVWCLEKNRPWLATAVFGLGALGRETNALGAAALVEPDRRTARDWLTLAARALLVAAPLVAWLIYVQWTVGASIDAGGGNFALPLTAYVQKWREVIGEVAATGRTNPALNASIFTLVALSVQALFFLLRPCLRQPWWRVGAMFAILMLFMGNATWEGNPGAAGRLLLPMQLAFNVLVPRGRRWLAVLVLGNLSLLSAPTLMVPPIADGFQTLRSPAMRDVHVYPRMLFDQAWFAAERRGEKTWRWASGSGGCTVLNPQTFAVRARLEFYLDTVPGHERTIAVSFDGSERWRGRASGNMSEPIVLLVKLEPGPNRLDFATREPARPVSGHTPRQLAFSLRNVTLELLRVEDALPEPGN